jgi:hypothetical protein
MRGEIEGEKQKKKKSILDILGVVLPNDKKNSFSSSNESALQGKPQLKLFWLEPELYQTGPKRWEEGKAEVLGGGTANLSIPFLVPLIWIWVPHEL